MSTIRMRATWVVEYDADPQHYAADGVSITPREMAEMDTDSDDVIGMMADGNSVSFQVEAVRP